MLINQLKTLDSREGIMERVSPGFPVSVYQMDFSCVPYHAPVSWHWHDDFQICWTNCGAVKFRVAGQHVTLRQNMGLFINCRSAHMAEPLTPGASYFGVNLHPDVICADTDSILYRKTILPFMQSDAAYTFPFSQVTPEGAAVLNAMRKIVLLSEQRDMPAWELLIQSELLSTWPTILQVVQRGEKSIKFTGNQRLKTILFYIHDNYPKKITLQDVARQVHLCSGECSRFFKKATGTSLIQYLIQYRIERSKELLCSTDLTIAEIAQAVGFSTQSYFTYCFQKHENCTPNQYRHMAHALLSPSTGHIKNETYLFSNKIIESTIDRQKR